MEAVQFRAHGGPEVLEHGEVEDPVAGPGQVLIRVEAAAVNWSDTVRRRNDPYPFPTPLPFVPGSEVAGTIAAVGDGVDGLVAGTPVFALVGADGSGGYAQFAVADATMVIPRPPHVPADEASGIIVAGGTAMLLLRSVAQVQPGQSVLVEAAGGGVGTFAVQIARALGAGVIVGTASTPERRAAALAVGADHVVDHTADGWSDEVRDLTGGGADVVLESVGGRTLGAAFAALAPFGRLVVYGCAGGVPGALTPAEQHALFYAPVLNQTITGFNIGLYFGLRPAVAVAALGELIELVASGRVGVQVGARLPLADAAGAHRLLEDRQSVGKVVLHPWA